MGLASAGDWVLTVGLATDFVGAVVMIKGMFKSPEVMRSIASQGAIIGGYTDEKAVREFQRDRLYGKIGGLLLSAGFLLQLVGRFL